MKVLSLYPSLFSLPSGTIKLVRTGFPCEVADASATIAGRKPRVKKRIWRNFIEYHKELDVNLL